MPEFYRNIFSPHSFSSAQNVQLMNF